MTVVTRFATNDGTRREKGLRLYMAVDTLGNLRVSRVTAVDVDDRVEIGFLTRTTQAMTGNSADVAFIRPTSRRLA